MRKTIIFATTIAFYLFLSSIAFKGEKINDEWNKEFEGLGISIFNDVKPTRDGYIIAGETAIPGIVDYHGWLVKTDKNGNKIWENIMEVVSYQLFWK